MDTSAANFFLCCCEPRIHGIGEVRSNLSNNRITHQLAVLSCAAVALLLIEHQSTKKAHSLTYKSLLICLYKKRYAIDLLLEDFLTFTHH